MCTIVKKTQLLLTDLWVFQKLQNHILLSWYISPLKNIFLTENKTECFDLQIGK